MRNTCPRFQSNFLRDFLQLVGGTRSLWFCTVSLRLNIVLLESDKDTLNSSRKWLVETLETVQAIANSCGVLPTGELSRVMR